MKNPFYLHWLTGWSFQIVFMDGGPKIEAIGFGICLRTIILPQESPIEAADRLVLSEQKRRHALFNSWKRKEDPVTEVINTKSVKQRYVSLLKKSLI